MYCTVPVHEAFDINLDNGLLRNRAIDHEGIKALTFDKPEPGRNPGGQPEPWAL